MKPVEQILYKPPVLDIGGVDRKMHRPNIFEVLDFAGIVSKVANVFTPDQWMEAGEKISPKKGGLDLEFAGKFLFQLIPVAGAELIVFLGKMVGMSSEDVHDGEKFPLGSELKIANAILECPDVLSFFTEGRKLLKNPGIKAISESMSSHEKSSASKGKQDGPTKQ